MSTAGSSKGLGIQPSFLSDHKTQTNAYPASIQFKLRILGQYISSLVEVWVGLGCWLVWILRFLCTAVWMKSMYQASNIFAHYNLTAAVSRTCNKYICENFSPHLLSPHPTTLSPWGFAYKIMWYQMLFWELYIYWYARFSSQQRLSEHKRYAANLYTSSIQKQHITLQKAVCPEYT